MTLIGYFIRRTYRTPPPIGKTICAQPHRIYPTRQDAEDAADRVCASAYFDNRYTYDIAEAWMRTEEDK